MAQRDDTQAPPKRSCSMICEVQRGGHSSPKPACTRVNAAKSNTRQANKPALLSHFGCILLKQLTKKYF
ncbi:MAG: hypothetical protein WA268_10500 [Xanthobacteraceae bacterium]